MKKLMPNNSKIFKFALILITSIFTLQIAIAKPTYSDFDNSLYEANRHRTNSNPAWLGDITRAIEIAIKLKEKKDSAQAYYKLFEFFCDSNKDKAMQFLELAKINKSARAFYKLAEMHFKGIDVKKDKNLGKFYLDKILNCYSSTEEIFDFDDGLIAQVDFLNNIHLNPEIDFEIVTLSAPKNALKNFEESGLTFDYKKSKEFAFKTKTEDSEKDIVLPIALTPEQLAKVKDKPALVPEAHILRLFSDYKEDGSDEELLVDIEIIKKKSKILMRKINNDWFRANAKINEEWDSLISYKYIGELSNGSQAIYAFENSGGTSYNANRFTIFYATKDFNSSIKIKSAERKSCNHSPSGSSFYDTYYQTKFYIEDDILIEQRYDYTFTFYTPLSEEQFRKTKLPELLKKLEARKKTEKPCGPQRLLR